MRWPLSLFIILLLTQANCPNSYAETATINQTYNAHSSEDFSGSQNILDVVPQGTKLTILKRDHTPSGNLSFYVKIVELGTSIPTTLTIDSPPFWIYYNIEKSLRVVELSTKEGKSTENTKIAENAKANRNFSIRNRVQNHAPAQPDSANCAQCPERTTSGITPSAAATAAVGEPIAQLQNLNAAGIEEVIPSVEEMTRFIATTAHHTSPKQIAQDHRIAADIIRYCGNDDPNVLIPLVLSIMKNESEFKVNALSRVGAGGLMQLMPGTARRLNGGKKVKSSDIETNIRLGVKYIKELLAKYDGSIPKVLAAYNAGEGAEKKFERTHRIYRETRHYIKNVSATLAQYYQHMKNTALSYVSTP